MKRLGWSIVASILLAVPLAASAADGYVTGNVNMRAGPDVQYPVVTVVPAGTPISIQGCTAGWEWCDVVSYGNRGWIAGNFIQYQYDDQPVLLPAYGARIGIPIVTFVIGTYWNNYYRNRPFYRDRARWYSRPIQRRPPPRPLNTPLKPIHTSARPGHRPQPTGGRPKPRPQPTGARPKSHPKPTGARPQSRPKPTGARPENRPPQATHTGTRPAPNKTKAKHEPKKKKPKDQDGGH
ncbi:MAG: SH3 domain-containing protein [Gemmataceae bacterium]